jgi:hypothetical protein
MTIDAMIGEGTGLAYHNVIWANGTIDSTMWTLCHASSGMLIAPYGVYQEEEAQEWLEKVANIFADKWQCDLVHLKRRFLTRRDTRAKIEAAHEEATIDDYFLYAAKPDPDQDCDYPYTESHTTAPTRNPDSPLIQSIVADLLKSYRHATKVYFVKMTPDGKHHTIRVYERETAKQTA